MPDNTDNIVLRLIRDIRFSLKSLFDAHQEIIRHYYRYPLLQLASMPADRQQIFTYPALTTDPEHVSTDSYKHFGLAITLAFMQTLMREEEKARRHESRYAYSLEHFPFYYSRKSILPIMKARKQYQLIYGKE